MHKFISLFVALLILANDAVAVSFPTLVSQAQSVYNQTSTQYKVSSNIMILVDMTRPSTEKRLWIIDLATNRVLLYTYVAHGTGSGSGIYATSFSNKNNSHATSLGRYLTGAQYKGKNGLSIRLYGLDRGVNDNAYNRSVVIHGSDYVTDKGVRGHSWGCLAVSRKDMSYIMSVLGSNSLVYVVG